MLNELLSPNLGTVNFLTKRVRKNFFFGMMAQIRMGAGFCDNGYVLRAEIPKHDQGYGGRVHIVEVKRWKPLRGGSIYSGTQCPDI